MTQPIQKFKIIYFAKRRFIDNLLIDIDFMFAFNQFISQLAEA